VARGCVADSWALVVPVVCAGDGKEQTGEERGA
jgi:hypothetical protein